MPVAGQHISNKHQSTNWEEVFSIRSVRQLRDTTMELLEALLSMQSVPRRYKQDKSRVQLVGRQSPGTKDVDTVTEGFTPM
jgi:hypothetical protein